MAIPAGWGALGFTSGRRTYRGNKLVGGVGNSGHLNGDDADFTAPMSVLRARFPGHPILDEGDHRHVGGFHGAVPYYGHQGIAGLVNGVDTTAPQGSTMLQPRKRPNLAAMSQVAGGFDPLAPQGIVPQGPAPTSLNAAYRQIIANPGGPMSAQQAPQDSPQAPLQPRKPHLNAAAIAGILGDAIAAYGGQRGVFAPMMADQRASEAEDNRFQQRLAAEIQARKEKAALDAQTPPQEFQTADYYNHLDPQSQQRFLQARDAIAPIVADIAQPDGSVRRSIIPRGQMGGGPQPGAVEDGYVYVGGDPANPNSWRPQ